MNVWHFFSTHRAEILSATREHLILVLISMAIAVAIAVPLGLALVSHRRLRSVAIAVASVFQTIPSLAPATGFRGSNRRTFRYSISAFSYCSAWK